MSAIRLTRPRAVTARRAALPIHTTVGERQRVAASGTDRWIHHTPNISRIRPIPRGPVAPNATRGSSPNNQPHECRPPESDRNSRSTNRLIATP